MARERGIVGGLIGPGAVMAKVGEDIGGAAEIGATAYERSRRTTLAEREQAATQDYRTKQLGMESEKLDLAKSLHPAALRQALSAAEKTELDVRQTVDKAGRQQQARTLLGGLLDRASKGEIVPSEEWILGMTNASMLSGHTEGVVKGLMDLRTLAEKGERGQAVDRVIRDTQGSLATFMRKPSFEEGMKILAVLDREPKATGSAAAEGLRKQTMETLAKLAPPVALEAIQRFHALKPDLKDARKTWERVLQEVPDAVQYFTTNPSHVPSEVGAGAGVEVAGLKKGAEAEAELPSKVRLERVKGEEAAKTAAVTAAVRTDREIRSADLAAAKAELTAAVRELDTLQRIEGSGKLFGAEKKKHENKVSAAKQRRDDAVKDLRRFGRQPETEKTGAGPQGLRADTLDQIDQVAPQFKNLADATANLNRWKSAGKISREEYDAALAKQAQRFGGK